MYNYCGFCGSDQLQKNSSEHDECLSCKKINFVNLASAGWCYLIDSEGNVGLARRAHEPRKGKYDEAGWFVDSCDLSCEDAIIRELKEELGISVAVGRLLTCWHIYRGHEETAENELVGITFLATTDQIEITLSDEHEEYRWVTPEEAKELIKVEGIHRDIQAYIDLQG